MKKKKNYLEKKKIILIYKSKWKNLAYFFFALVQRNI